MILNKRVRGRQKQGFLQFVIDEANFAGPAGAFESGTHFRDVRRGSDGQVSSGKLLLRRRDGEFHEPAFVQGQLEVQRFHVADVWKIQTKMPSPPSTISEWRRNLLSVFVGRLRQREVHGSRLPLGIGID